MGELATELAARQSLGIRWTKGNSVVHFCEQEIEAARGLRRAGLPWQPAVGHYVYDETGIVEQDSPFQEKVYFILNHAYFMRLVGGEDRFKERMLWLPTWDDLRHQLRELNVSDTVVESFLVDQGAIAAGRERLALYELIASRLAGSSNMPAEVSEAIRN